MAKRWLRSLVCFGLALALATGGPGLLPAQSVEPTSSLGVAAATKQGFPDEDLGGEDTNSDRPALPLPVLPTDIQSYWAKDCITALAQQRLFTPDSSRRFYPDQPILWGDYVELLNQIIPSGPAQSWANPLERALGVSTAPTVAAHYPDQYFQRDRPLLRGEAIMALATKLEGDYQLAANTLINASLEDGPQVPQYAREGVASALALGVVVNYPASSRLNSTQRLTRGEAAALACRAAPNPALRRQIDPAWVAAAQIPAVASPARETRGVWLTNVDSQVLFSTEALETAVDRLADLNFNTIYPVVWNYGHTLYPSATAQRELGVSQHLYGDLRAPGPASESDRDMLQEAVDFGHARGMAVVPWFEFGFMAPASYELYRRHPDWFTQRLDPTPFSPNRTRRPADAPKLATSQNSLKAKDSAHLPTVLDVPKTTDLMREKHRADQWVAQDDVPLDPALADDPGIWMEGNVIPRRWMNPFHPQVQKFQLELINDLVSNYEVDGFQFDDHLGLPVDFGYDPFTINLYRAEHGGRVPPSNPEDAEWVAWRADKISDFLAEVYKLVKARRPNAVVSISPNPYPFAYANYLQDWPEWVNRGIVDELVIQVYRSDQNRFMWEMNKPSIRAARRKIPVSLGILSGLRARPVKMEFITDQTAAVRDRAYSGMSFFFYESLWISPPPETADQRVDQLREVFATPASRPSR
ncbi:MAG: family 10 glycosylhydrolase [Nodosilinea sp.]